MDGEVKAKQLDELRVVKAQHAGEVPAPVFMHVNGTGA